MSLSVTVLGRAASVGLAAMLLVALPSQAASAAGGTPEPHELDVLTDQAAYETPGTTPQRQEPLTSGALASLAAAASDETTQSTWLSGAAGDGVSAGSFGAWRGTPVTIAGTWNDSFEAQTAQWTIQPGAEFGSWQGDIDIAIGAIYANRGETWARAASGAYDARWARALQEIKKAWGNRPGTVHIRFAHEFNGDWSPWRVSGRHAEDFIAAWRRFAGLQSSIMPSAKLVFCPNDLTSASLRLDWRKAFPGTAYVDEMAVDSYNQDPFVNSARRFVKKINSTDGHGAPSGLETHRQFAAAVGLPLAIAEWNSNAMAGDADRYMRLFHDWVAANAGRGAGRIPYEILFNVSRYGSGEYALSTRSLMPRAAAAYVATF